MLLSVVFYAFVVFTGIQILYYLYFSSILFKSKKAKNIDSEVPISVIIFVKNKGKALQKNLSHILEQEYPKFEVVLVNNFSTDDTTTVIEDFQQKNKKITIIDVENTEAFWGNKKYALTLGIKAAKYEHILFTEANSKPISKYWIAEMSKSFHANKTIILGYTKYQVTSSITNILARFNNLQTALQNFTFAKFGTPFMAFNANFAYQKSTFFKVKGFINHMKIKSGEHDLFIKDAASKKNTAFVTSKNSFVHLESPKSFFNWVTNLRESRVLSKKYKLKHQFMLSFFTFSKLMFYILGTLLFFYYPYKIILATVLSYFSVHYLVLGFSAKKFKEPYLLFFLPFLEISLLLIQISIFIANLISKPNH